MSLEIVNEKKRNKIKSSRRKREKNVRRQNNMCGDKRTFPLSFFEEREKRKKKRKKEKRKEKQKNKNKNKKKEGLQHWGFECGHPPFY